jgi:hypothetical protein
VNRSRALNVPFTLFTRTVANESLQKRPNFHFESKQSRANKFCRKWQLRFIMQRTVFSQPILRMTWSVKIVS